MKALLFVLLLSSTAQAARYIVESKLILSQKDLKSHKFKIEPFARTKHSYFSKLYIISGNLSKGQLKKLSWVKNIEETVELSKFSLLPAENPEKLVEDELFPYQWALLSQGQTFFREKDDIHNLPMKALPNTDVGWRDILPHLNGPRPIIAVLDSGVDTSHPELQNNLWKNVNECGKDQKVDNDANGLPGDCLGWNFTEDIDSDDAKIPTDNDGHGTHVAGIIASANDGVGIVGVAPNALIMPIKVMKDSNSKSEIASSEAFARGIFYATDNGANVINMSLGWPKALETKHLREAVFYALSKNVVIIAAAGNNNNSEPLFPCAYEGVICVAASTLNGNFAGFSNYGGHIDTIAPGEGILGLYPILYEPEFFPVPHYEVKSGTSQAAPFVAGLVGILKSKKPELRIDDIFARLYLAPQNPDKSKYIMGGEARWASLNQDVTVPVIRPIFKRVRQLVVKSNPTDLKISIPIKNYGVDSNEIKVSIESLSKSIFFSTDMNILTLKSYETKDATFSVSIGDVNAESNIDLKVTIDDGLNVQSYLNNIPVVRDIRDEPNLKKLGFSFVDRPLPVGKIDDNQISSNLTKVDSPLESGKHELFLRRGLKDGDKKKIEITLFSRQKDKYVQAPKLFLIDNAISLVNFIRVDLNLDGREDYLIQTVIEKDSKKFFMFSFYNDRGDALWPNFQDVKLLLDAQIESLNDLSFIRANSTLGDVLLPAFFTTGQIPKIDQVVSDFDQLDLTQKKRLYYLEPQKDSTLKIRALVNNIWEEGLKKELKAKWYETVEVESLLPVSATDINRGELRVLVSVGDRTKREIFIQTFKADSGKRGPKIPQLVLQSDTVDPLYAVTTNGLEISGDVYLNIVDRTRAKIVTTKQTSQASELDYLLKAETDLIAGHLVSFENGQDRLNVIQTRDRLISISTDGEIQKITERSKLRYSFLTQKLLSEMYYPVTFKREGVVSAALYVDSTAVTGNRVYLFENQEGNLVSSVKNSLIVPGNCRALDPAFSQEVKNYEFLFLCFEDKQFVIRSLEMN